MLSAVIILGCFIGVVLAIISEKINRAVAAQLGAVITYFVLIFLEDNNFSLIVELLFGSELDGYVNLHSLILIIGMSLIVHISHEAGVFQFFAAKLVKTSKGKPIPLLVILCTITVIISSVLNNILTVMIIIPLTITISRMLNIDPTQYILTQAVLVNIGGTIFPISSIPNILISTAQDLSFIEFTLIVGSISIIVYFFTLLFFIFLLKSHLTIPEDNIQVLEEFNAWNYVPNKPLLYKSVISIIVMFILFFIIPSSVIPSSIISLSIALLLIITSRLNMSEIIEKIDMELILYLLGIFIIAGGLEVVGVITTIGNLLKPFAGNNILTSSLLVLWFSAIMSSNIDNIPITKVLIPVVDEIAVNTTTIDSNLLFYSLAIGANWGDNLTPLGDNILVMNIANKHKRPISFKQFFKIGFTTTIYQLIITSIIVILFFDFLAGLIVIIGIFAFLGVILISKKYGSLNIQLKIDHVINRSRRLIVG